MNYIILVAMSLNKVIGKNNSLLWRQSQDMQRFKEITSGNTVVMGRKTFNSLGNKPLPNRRNIILSKTLTPQKGVDIYNCIEELEKNISAKELVFIIGGGEIYTQFLDKSSKIELTLIEANFKGDTYFPDIDLSKWELIKSVTYPKDFKNEYIYAFKTFKKI